MAELYIGNNQIGGGGGVDTSAFIEATQVTAAALNNLKKITRQHGKDISALDTSITNRLSSLYENDTSIANRLSSLYENDTSITNRLSSYSSSIISLQNEKADASTVYTKSEIDMDNIVVVSALASIDTRVTSIESSLGDGSGSGSGGGSGSADLSNYYNKSEIDSSFGETFLVKITNTNGQYYYVPRTMSDADKQAILSRANSSSGAIIFDNPENSSDNIFGMGAIMIGNSYAKGTKSIASGYKTEAIGNYTHSEGYSTKATYSASHAEGYFTIASGAYSHTEGNTTTASGRNAHAEGTQTNASGESSHAEGWYTTASGKGAHAEGASTYAIGNYSHAEGVDTSAYYAAHSEGYGTKASNNYAHAEGRYTVAASENQHVEGLYNADASNALHIIGNGTKDSSRHNALEVHKSGEIYISDTFASGEVYQKPMMNLQNKLHEIDTSIALALSSSGGGGSSDFITDGSNNMIRSTISSENQTSIKNFLNYTENAIIISTPPSDIDFNYGDNSISLGAESQGVGTSSIAHGFHAIAYGGYSHAEGNSTNTSGGYSHAEGTLTSANGTYSHAEGTLTSANGTYSHAEGNSTKANGEGAHAEGKDTSAYGDYSHAEGTLTSATGNYSHSEGRLSVASGMYSHAEGGITEANQNYLHVEGTCNLTVTNALHIIGNGTTRLNKHNAFEVHKSGEIFISDIYSSGEVYQKSMMSLNAKLKEIDDLRDSITTESLILDANNGINAELYIRDSNGDLYQIDIDTLCLQFGNLVQE